MAGYCEFSKSNNALAAEAAGRYTATALGRRLGCTAAACKALLAPVEWHHTSGWYNPTDYYDEPVLLALAAGDRRTAIEALDGSVAQSPADPRPYWVYLRRKYHEGQQLLASLRAHGKTSVRCERTWTGCTVQWLEWSGTRRRPTADEREADGCTVVYKGSVSLTVLPPGMKPFRKRIGTNGFSVRLNDGSELFGSWETLERVQARLRKA